MQKWRVLMRVRPKGVEDAQAHTAAFIVHARKPSEVYVAWFNKYGDRFEPAEEDFVLQPECCHQAGMFLSESLSQSYFCGECDNLISYLHGSTRP